MKSVSMKRRFSFYSSRSFLSEALEEEITLRPIASSNSLRAFPAILPACVAISRLSSIPLGSFAPVSYTHLNWIENLSLSEAMKKLTPRERHILNMRFFEGKTQMEVAKEISISQAQVSRLEKNALKYMRKYV